jgi:predicted nucleotidyltransferase
MLNTETAQLKIKSVAEKYGLSLAVLFGSQATGAVHPKSDVDIAVIGVKISDKLALGRDLETVFGRHDVELVDLGTATPTMMYAVVRDGKALYEKSSGTFLKWKLYAMWVWRDTAWLRRLRDRKLVEWAKTA